MNSKSAKSRPLKARKIWRNLEATGLIAFGSLAGCSGEGNEQRAASDADATQVVEGSTGIGEGIGEGVGEGAGEGAGEGEGAINSALTAADDVAYLTQLGLMRGHLWVGHQLYQNNLHGMAITHMKHPKAELYSSLKEPFDIRRVDGFAAELETLASSVENKEPAVEVEQAYVALTSAIKRTELGADTMSPGLVGEVIVALLRTAGEEYAIGVVDGKINNLHEYQDALGFTKIAGEWSRSAAFANNSEATAAAARIQSILTDLDAMWPALDPEGALPHKAAQLFGAAARVEIETLGL